MDEEADGPRARLPPPARWARLAPPARWARLGTGVRLPYVETGDEDGVPVVFLHPYADSHRFFEPALPYLPTDVHAFLPTQRGHGDARMPPGPPVGYSLAEVSEDVGAFLDAVGLGRAVLVGHSSGGYVAQRFAVDHPDRCLGLLLVGSPHSLHGRRPPFAAAVEAMRDPVRPADVRAVMTTIPLRQPVPAWFVEEMVAESAKMSADVWRAALRGLTDAAPPTDGATLAAPTLIVFGTDDDLLPQEHTALAAAIPGARLVGYPGTGHLVCWEQPSRLAADVAAFARELGRGEV